MCVYIYIYTGIAGLFVSVEINDLERPRELATCRGVASQRRR